VYGNGNGPNGNGNELFSAPSRSFHFTYSDSAAAFVAAVAETETSESVSTPSRSFHHHTPRFHCHFLPWRSLVTAGGGSMEGHSFPFQSSVKGDSYPGLSAQRTAEVGGFGPYLVSIHM